ncbi:unnamed protein product [Penicillium salamii]|nr:unnamed protein product [Penicillium salamii]
MGERERVDDQKLSTNGGFWTLPPRLLRTSLLFVPEPRTSTMRPRRTSTRERLQFYNLVLFISSVAIFSLTAQRLSGPKSAR